MPAVLPVDRRREVFATLVARQDAGLSVPDPRGAVCREYKLEARLALAIEREGLKTNWPPLDA